MESMDCSKRFSSVGISSVCIMVVRIAQFDLSIAFLRDDQVKIFMHQSTEFATVDTELVSMEYTRYNLIAYLNKEQFCCLHSLVCVLDHICHELLACEVDSTML